MNDNEINVVVAELVADNTKAELLKLAEANGVTVAKSATKLEIAGAIVDARQSGGSYGSAVIASLEAAWAKVQQVHGVDVPNVVMITGSGRGMFSLKWGHHARDRWSNGSPETRITELMITGECLDQGATAAMETLIHEAAHAVANSRGIADTSRDHRYHNKKFVAVAEELGLREPNAEEIASSGMAWPNPSIGFSDVRITDDTVDVYSTEIDGIQSAINDARIDSGLTNKGRDGSGAGGPVPKAPTLVGPMGGTIGGGAGGGSRTSARRVKISCCCDTPRNVWGSRSVVEVADIICGECDSKFLEG